MDTFMFLGFNIYAWITIVTVLSMFTVLLLTKLRTDLGRLSPASAARASSSSAYCSSSWRDSCIRVCSSGS